MTREELQTIVLPELKKHFGLTEEEACERIGDELDEFDEAFYDDGMAELTVCDLEVGGKTCSISLTAEESVCNCYIQYGQCLDVEGANRAMDAYDATEAGKLLPVENAVESEGDALMLTYDIEIDGEEELKKGISDLFGLLKSPDREAEIAKLCKYFR